jgi:ABC-type nickel/cobalt efflux system permease component RcnA
MNPRLALLFLLAPAVAGAHPLGNFTINRYARLTVAPDAIAVHHVVDMAEIPAFQAVGAIDGDDSGAIDPPERMAYLARMADEIARGLVLEVDGTALGFAVSRQALELPPGAGGLPTLRLETDLAARLARVPGRVTFVDRTFAGRAGWREVVADAGDGLGLADSTVPRADRSNALRAYPADELTSPPQVSEARFRVVAGGPDAVGAAPPAGAGSRRFADRLSELVGTREPLRPAVVLAALLLAAGLGALHALGPGHGKTIVGAYLVGTRGTASQALLLGLVVTATHTAGVYALGLVTLTASRYVVPERLFPWLGLVSGLLVLSIGASLAGTRLRAAGEHDHHHDDHDHHHHHGHGHHHHHHVPDDPASRSLLALGVSGGLVPCPSALVVMLGAIALGRVAFGLLLIVAFSAGLAAVLTGIGLVLVYARGLFQRLPVDGRLVRYVPVASAVVIAVVGLGIVVRALGETGVLAAWT